MKNKTTAIVIPSYNEVKNLSILLRKITKELSHPKIIIVDDSSKDENWKLKNVVQNQNNITLISRFKKEGRGSAVLEGFREALNNKKIKYIFEMDSDLAHDTKEFVRFTDKIKKEDLDLVIGSRYLPGGKIKNIAKRRTILSRIINKFLYFWLGMRLSDHTSGFRLYSRKSVEFLIKSKIKSKGFITLSESAYKLFLGGFKITEVPITWNYRKYGKSNVNLNELLNSLFFVILIKFQDQFFKKVIAIVAIFIFALSLRIYTLNQIGRTWDEFEYIEQGYKLDELIIKGDFSNSYFYTTYDHPPLAKYIYGITAHLDKSGIDSNGNPIFKYDYTFSRLLSAVFASLSSVLILLLGWRYISPFIGMISGIIFSMLPFFVGLSQLVSTESILMFLFTASVYSFIQLLDKFTVRKVLITGFLVGLALLTKQSNGLLYPLFGLFYVIWFLKVGKQLKLKFTNNRFWSLFAIGIISIFSFVVLWPMPYFHLDVINEINQRIWLVKTAPPTIFWGVLILSPVMYFVTLFIITTPLLIILLFLVGLKAIDLKRNWIMYILIVWFAFPFIQSFYPWRVHGVRYIIEIYAPLSIIVAIGINYLIKKYRLSTNKKVVSILTLALYLFFTLYQIKPYYLDYFNELVGGTKGVYYKKYFELGWWGQGLKEAGYYIDKNANKNSVVCIYVSPLHSFPDLKNVKVIQIYPKNSYNPNIKCDYIVVNNYHVLRESFDDSGIRRDYRITHQVTAGGGSLVDIYIKK